MGHKHYDIVGNACVSACMSVCVCVCVCDEACLEGLQFVILVPVECIQN